MSSIDLDGVPDMGEPQHMGFGRLARCSAPYSPLHCVTITISVAQRTGHTMTGKLNIRG